MKAIELTEEHKSKLLEMCKILFPEYFFDEEGEDYYIDENNIINFLIPIKENEFKGGEIHWFEFCTNEIVNELAWRNIETEILADCEYENFRMKLITKIFKDKLVGNNFHIIDYLYKQFQKLK